MHCITCRQKHPNWHNYFGQKLDLAEIIGLIFMYQFSQKGKSIRKLGFFQYQVPKPLQLRDSIYLNVDLSPGQCCHMKQKDNCVILVTIFYVFMVRFQVEN